MIKIRNDAFIIIFVLLIFSCSTETSPYKSAGKEIVIGIVRSSTSSNFFTEGVEMAAESINNAGGLLGKKIKIVIYDDKDDMNTGEEIAKQLSENKEVIAVIGHRDSIVAKAASVIYQNAGILFISYGSKDPKLMQSGSNLILRNIPTYNEFSLQIAQFINNRGMKKILLFCERNATQVIFSDLLKKAFDNLEIEVVATRSYFPKEDDFRKIITDVNAKYDFDAVFIAANDLPTAASLIRQMREMGINVPIAGGDSLDSPDLWSIAGKSADKIVVPTVFNPDDPNKLTRNFVRQFESKYGFIPDTWAAQGYDALKLLSSAIEESSSLNSKVLSSAIRFSGTKKGVTGTYSFTQTGDITDKKIFFKAMRDGQYKFLDVKNDYESDLFNYIEDFTLRLPLEGSVTSIDPAFIGGDVIGTEVTEQLFIGLTGLDPKTYQAVPEFAKKWKVSSDNKSYTFYLNDDFKWTNGEPVTAHDVVWAIRRNIDPKTKSSVADMLNPLRNALEIKKGIKDVSEIGVHAADNFTVVFDLEYPTSYFLSMTGLPAYWPQPGKVIEKYKNRWTDPENIQTSGPYRLISWQPDKGVFLKKNQTYYNAENVLIPEVRYFVIPQSSIGLAMYNNNELDIMGSSYLRIPFKSLSMIKNNPLFRDEYSRQPIFSTYAYAFNTKLKPVDNPLVRKAIAAAIDRKLLIEAVTRGDEEPAITFTTPPVFGSVNQEEDAGIVFDPIQAQKWLSEAGYPGGKDFPEITIMYNKSETHEKIALAIQSLLKHYLNINIRTEGREWNQFITDIVEGSPTHIFRTGVVGDYPDADSWMTYFHPSKSSFRTGLTDKEFTDVLDKAAIETDSVQRKAFYRRAEQILCKDLAVVIPLYFETAHCLVKPRIKGWYHMAIGGQHILKWRIEKEKR